MLLLARYARCAAIINFPLNLFTPFDQTAKDPLQFHKSIRNSGKIANKLKTGAPGIVNTILFVTQRK